MPALAALMLSLVFFSVLDVSMFIIASVAVVVKKLSVASSLTAILLRLAPHPRVAFVTVVFTRDFPSDETVFEL